MLNFIATRTDAADHEDLVVSVFCFLKVSGSNRAFEKLFLYLKDQKFWKTLFSVHFDKKIAV